MYFNIIHIFLMFLNFYLKNIVNSSNMDNVLLIFFSSILGHPILHYICKYNTARFISMSDYWYLTVYNMKHFFKVCFLTN